MAKGALYWRLKDEKTGKWSYKKATIYQRDCCGYVKTIQEEE